MEYEFIHDGLTGKAKAVFSFEHQVLGPWLEVEVSNSTDAITNILTAIDSLEKNIQQEVNISGKEYNLILTKEDASISPNAMANGTSELPEELLQEGVDFDEQMFASCGLEDFRELVTAWAHFTKF